MLVNRFKLAHLQIRRRGALCSIAFSFLSLLLFELRLMAAQAPIPGQQEVVGRLSGDDVSVKGAISFDTEQGHSTAMLGSGSELTLRSGQAKIDLVEGGDIILCGPAHLSILKSGLAVTIALDYGQVHLQVGTTAQVTLYTPSVIVTPVAIGSGTRDVTVGLDEKGELCAMALSGAIRMAQQLTGESLVVPQGGDIQVDGGELRQIRGGSQKCSCELLVSRSTAPTQREVPSDSSLYSPKAAPPDRTTYRIDMPPLAFNASTPAPVLTADAILLIRESMPDQAIRFQGVVKPALPPPPAEHSPSSAPSSPRSRTSKPRLLAKLFGIFRWL